MIRGVREVREIDVTNDPERYSRGLDWTGMANDQVARDKQAKRSNAGFTQVSNKGWARITDLIAKNPQAARTYCFLAQHVSGEINAVTVSQETLAEATGTSVSTIKRHTKELEDMRALIRLRVGPGTYAYCLDPEEIWRYWGNAKKFAAFNTKTLVSKKANAVVARQMKMLFGTADEEEPAA